MVSVTPTNAKVVLVDKPDEDSIFVLLTRVRPCYDELPDISWTGHSGVKSRKRKSQSKESQKPEKENEETEYKGPVARSMARKQRKFEGKL